MADILIRGMEMPKYTTKAEFGIDADGNPLCMVYHEDGNEPDIYAVVLLPEGHGRLIDADALKKYWQACEEKLGPKNTLGLLTYHDVLSEAVIYDLDKAPTIVPAEGGGEDG